MRPLCTALALAALAASDAPAQARWTPEVGVRGGFVHLKPAGTGESDQTDALDIPGFGYGSIFAVIPVGGRFALEPNVALTQLAVSAPTLLILLSGTGVNLGLRADYAITRDAFAALGGQLLYSEAGGEHDTQFGVQAAVGYRAPLSDRLTGRLEAQLITMARGRRETLPPVNRYGVLLGLSARAAGHTAPRAETVRWEPALGVAVGYSRTHLSTGGLAADFILLAAPGTPAAAGVPAPPTMFLIIPLTARLALEPGFDIHRAQSGGTTTFAGTVSARVNVAVGPRWYGGLGPALQVIKNTGSSAFGVAGIGLAWGARFPLTGDLGGRVELGYAMFKERSGSPFAANTLSVMFGASMPLR